MGTVKALLGEGTGSGSMDHGVHVVPFAHVRRPRYGKEGMMRWAWKWPLPLATSCINNNNGFIQELRILVVPVVMASRPAFAMSPLLSLGAR